MSSGQPFRRLLLLTFGPLVAVVLTLLGLGLGAISVAADSVEQLVFRVQPLQRANAELRATMLDSSRGLRGYTYSGDATYREAYDRGHQSYARSKDEVTRLAVGSEQDAAHELAELADHWFDMTSTVRSAGPGGQRTGVLLANGSLVLDEFLRTSNELAAEIDVTSASLQQSSAATRRQAQLVLLACGALAIVFAIAAATATARRFSDSVAGLRTTVTRWAAGDRDARVPEHGLADMREVARSINTMVDEATRLHDVERERERCRDIAAGIGVRIREHLDVDEVVRLATTEIGRHFDAERVCVWLAEGVLEDTEAELATPEWHELDLAPLRSTLDAGGERIPIAPLRTLYAERRSQVVRFAADAEALGLPQDPRDGAMLVVPFGRGEIVLGAVVVVRSSGAWPLVEVDALEHVAADLARGVDQARLYQEQQVLVRDLRALDRSKTEFVSNVSHELRTPMTSIAGYVEMLRDGDGGTMNDCQRTMLEVVHRNATRLRKLIEELLLLAKLESGAVDMAAETVDVSSLVEGVVDTLRPAAKVGGVRLDRENDDELIVIGDPAHLDRVLTNLVSNAVKFTPAGGEVHVTSRRCHDGWIEVEVTDTGIGIPETEQQAMFTRFHRATNATEKAIPGSGLGLAIVRQIVHRHGGHVALASKEGAGTTATVRLPAAGTGETA
ncbi:HAMP domain-containing protein [Lentzea tibetensis]|uniref:histidine kinase n=1 Tax=Lentzea tibetensis TaxID=2591470 RepID=A0A563EXM0_9PSEU|nr:ATP-binding protein [Lentzea tibetensis]TWP52383.1 HAMP domain-containing protein [Lentzea tibetensis]